MDSKYKPMWMYAAGAIVLIFGLIYGVSALITYQNMFSAQTLAGVIIGIAYIGTVLRLADKRASFYVQSNGKKIGKYKSGINREKSTDIISRIPAHELDEYGLALKEDLRRCRYCINAYSVIFAVLYFLLMPRV